MRSTLRRRLRSWRRLGLPGIPAAAALALLLCSSALAAPAWHAPRELSGSNSAPLGLAATAGLSPDGNGVVLWHAEDGVEAVVRAAGRGFGAPRAILGSELSMPDLRPSLAFDSRGAALAVWSYFEPHPHFVEDGYAVDYTFGLRVAGKAARGGFGRAQTLTEALDADPSADVAFDPKGTAVVIWTDQAGMHAAARQPGKRRFGRAQVIGQTQADPQVRVGSSGSAVAAWAAEGAVRAAVSDGLPSFASAKALKIPGLGKSKPVLGIDGRSSITAAWSSDGRVMAATCRASGRCGRALALSPRGEKASDPRVAVAADGTAVIAWRSAEGVSAALRSGHRGFGSPGRLAKLENGQKATGLAVAVGPDGDAATLWTVHGADGERVQAALRHGAHARFAKASPLTGWVAGARWSDPQVVLNEDGDALAVWGAMVDGRPSIQASAFDAG